MKIVGIWGIPEGTDPVPSAFRAMMGYDGRISDACNLCTLCGARIWTEDMQIHENWHWGY